MLYAVGGCDENNLRLHTMERYSPTTDTWSFVPPMSTCRSSPCVIGDKYLYVIGGVSYVGIALNTGEKFDPHTNTWTKLPPMSTKRASACGAVVNGKIYVIGRFRSTSILQSFIPNFWLQQLSKSTSFARKNFQGHLPLRTFRMSQKRRGLGRDHQNVEMTTGETGIVQWAITRQKFV